MKGVIPPGTGKYLSLGVELAAGFLGGMFLGYQVDKWIGYFPVCTVVGTIGGMGLGFYNMYVRLTRRD